MSAKTDDDSNAGRVELAIKEGGFYRDAEGKKIGPMRPLHKMQGVWYSGGGKETAGDWFDNGQAVHGFPKGSPYYGSTDLIAEWTDETLRAAQHTPADAPAPQAEPAPSLDNVRRQVWSEAISLVHATSARFDLDPRGLIEDAMRAAATADEGTSQ